VSVSLTKSWTIKWAVMKFSMNIVPLKATLPLWFLIFCH